jgi:hypothetical protein
MGVAAWYRYHICCVYSHLIGTGSELYLLFPCSLFCLAFDIVADREPVPVTPGYGILSKFFQDPGSQTHIFEGLMTKDRTANFVNPSLFLLFLDLRSLIRDPRPGIRDNIPYPLHWAILSLNCLPKLPQRLGLSVIKE